MKIKSQKQLVKFISTIATKQEKINEQIQIAVSTIAGHVYAHGDNTSIRPLLDATRGANRQAIMEWLQKYAFVDIDKDGNVSTSKTKKSKAVANNAQEIFDYCMSDCPRWYDLTKTIKQEARALNVANRINSLAKQIYAANDVTMNMHDVESAIRNLRSALDSKVVTVGPLTIDAA